MDARSLIEKQIAAHEQATQVDFERVGQLTLQQRADLVDAACGAAVELAAERRRLGIPPISPAPWPESTWDLLRRFAPNGAHG
jgi:hypothetical protein